MENLSGTTVHGYELQERIGSGGFGAVYKARQTTISREVAIKIVLPGFANRPDFIRCFESEAQLVARLEHPFIVPLFDYWRDPGGAYLVMRWLRGGSLKDALVRDRYGLDSTMRLMEQITAALSTAHRNNIIHRDLKPGNILLDEDCNAYLADFGIAKDTNVTNGELTEPDQLIGSPDYLAPEQARSEPVTPHTDIYSLGVVLYEMLAGDHPFPNMGSVERLFKHLNEPLPLIEDLDPDIQEAVNDVIQKATQKNPLHRYADVLEMMVALRQAVANRRDTSGDSMVELLTMREQEILQCVIDGLSNKEIAEKLFITVGTVKWYVRQIFKKLHVRSRVQAIVRARELNLVVPDSDGDKPTVIGGTTSVSHLPEPENPYKGLRAFQPADEKEFFGREQLTRKILKRMAERGAQSRFLAIVGPSGSGKSSLVKAGLIPALWRGEIPGSEKWFIVEMLPGPRPLDELEIALMRVAADQAANLGDQLRRDQNGLLRVAQLILPDDGSELVLIIDQFEEAFTLLENEEQRLDFLNLLFAAVTDKRSRIRIVSTLRADFYDRPLMYPEFGELVRDRTETVLPLNAKELESAILNPAKQIGVSFEEGLVATIADEVSYQPGALPLLQYALTELFERRESRTLTHASYQEIGGAVGALAQRTEELYAELSDDAQEITRQMFLRLVTLGEGVEDSRRRTSHSELAAMTTNEDLLSDIIDMFVEYRLLSLDHDPATRTPTVEVAHEAILREWERLQNWLNESRADVRMQRQLARKAEEWRDADQDTAYLLRGSQLEIFEGWMAETGLVITPQERSYLDASSVHQKHEEAEKRAQEEREAGLEKRVRLVLQGLVAILLIAAVIAGGLALWANSERAQAEDEKIRAEHAEYDARRQASIGLATQALTELEGADQDRAVLLALEALEHYPYTAQAESALAQVVETYVPYRSLMSMYVSAWSPDGERIAIGLQEASIGEHVGDAIYIIDADTSTELLKIRLETACVIPDVDWSPDGDRLVSITAPNVWREDCPKPPMLWDANTGDQLLTLTAHEGVIFNVDWSPDGERILTAGEDGTTMLLDASTGAAIHTLDGHTDAVRDVMWSPDGNLIASASLDGTARIWDAETGDELLAIGDHTGGVTGVAWSPDGERIVTASEDGLARVWDVSTGEVLLNLIGHSAPLMDVAYSPAGDQIASASLDGTARVWDASSGELLVTRHGLTNELQSVVWSPDGNWLAVGDGRNENIWDMSAQPLKLVGHAGINSDGAWSPDGTRIATSGFDGTTRIWDAATGEALLALEHPDQVPYFAWSPDGTRIATPCGDGIARIWDAVTGEVLVEVHIGTGILEASWSPDGSRVAVFDMTSNATVFDAETGELLASFTMEDILAAYPEPEFCMQFRPSWSPDGEQIVVACGAHRRALIWDAATGELLNALDNQEADLIAAEWSPNGSRIVTGQVNGAVRVWDAETQEILLTFGGHTDPVWDVSWSPDGTRIMSVGHDAMVRVWNAETGAQVFSFETPGNAYSVNWSPDGSYAIVAGASNVPIVRRVWQSTEELITYAKACCIARELTPEEREQFGLPLKEPR